MTLTKNSYMFRLLKRLWGVEQKTAQHAKWNIYPKKKAFKYGGNLNGVILFIHAELDFVELERVW